MKKYFLVIIILVILGITVYLSQNNNSNQITTTVPNQTVSSKNITTTPNTSSDSLNKKPNSTYSLADINKHNSFNDCWTTVNTKVFDITSFISSHPGGKVIIQACGKDATDLFNNERAHQRNNAESTLDQYLIGSLN